MEGREREGEGRKMGKEQSGLAVGNRNIKEEEGKDMERWRGEKEGV